MSGQDTPGEADDDGVSFWFAEGYSVGYWGTEPPTLADLDPPDRAEYDRGLDTGARRLAERETADRVAARYVTLLVVVPVPTDYDLDADLENGLGRALELAVHTPFAVAEEGVTVDAEDAGADPSSWPERADR